MDRYVVIGNPVAHSKSPVLYRLFADQTTQFMQYNTLLGPLDDFAGCASAFFQHGCGANVTVPFKEDAYRWANRLTPRAKRAGAVNTLSRLADGTLLGDNTDGAGLVRDLTVNAGFSLKDKRILVLGAGGAARGALEPLLAEKPALVTVANRTVEKAKVLANLFSDLGLVPASFFDCSRDPVDLIINATSASLAGGLPQIPSSLIEPGKTLCYDMMYGKQQTPFCAWAIEHGASKVMDGLGMLAEQAGEAFFLWRGVHPDTASALAELRRLLTTLAL